MDQLETIGIIKTWLENNAAEGYVNFSIYDGVDTIAIVAETEE